MIKAVVSDSDGTLFNSLETYYNFFKKICREAGKPYIIQNGKGKYFVSNPADLKPFFREPYHETYILLGFNWELDRSWIEKEHTTYMCKNIPSVVPGMYETLKDLKARKTLLGLVTSADPDITEIKLRSTNIFDLFDVIISNDKTKRAKPAPDYLLECFGKLNVAPEGTPYIGDQPADIQATKAARARDISVTWGFSDYQTLLKEEPTEIVRNVKMLRATLNL